MAERYCDERQKVCGILTEMSAQLDYINHVVIGIGINVQNESFPKEIEQVATSILMETGQHVNRAELIEAVLEQFERYYEIFLETEDLSGLVKEYNAHLINMQKQVRVLDPKEPYEAKAMGITPHGELIVDTWEGRKLVSLRRSFRERSIRICLREKKWCSAERALTIKILSESGF